MAASRQVLVQSFEKLGSIGAVKVVIELPKAYIPLPSEPELQRNPEKKEPAKFLSPKNKSFNLHIGGILTIPSADAKAKPQYINPLEQKNSKDPFEGLPFRAFAERMGERILPAVEAAREQQRLAAIEGRTAAESSQAIVPLVPHFLPFTRWAAQSDSFRSTFVADEPAKRKKARLSWYHPDDTMVPRDWWKGGLLADMEYYSPFGIGKK